MHWGYLTIERISPDRYNEMIKQAEIDWLIKSVKGSKPTFFNHISFKLNKFFSFFGQRLKQQHKPVVTSKSFQKRKNKKISQALKHENQNHPIHLNLKQKILDNAK